MLDRIPDGDSAAGVTDTSLDKITEQWLRLFSRTASAAGKWGSLGNRYSYPDIQINDSITVQ